jgi:hypothetical protein
MLQTPDAPASSRQLWKLHTLTGEDTRGLDITMQEAHDKIAQLEAGRIHKWEEMPSEWRRFIETPMSFADARLFFGDQGQGKSITTVACVIDDVYNYITHVVTPDGEIIKANSLGESEVAYLESPKEKGGLGIRYNHLKHIRIFNDDGTKSKIVAIPPTFTVISPVKVFANRTFYGIRYMPFDIAQFIQYINTPLMANGWVVLSESVLISRKDTMSYVGRFMEWFGAECRKRHLRMVIDMQYRKMLNSTFHLYATTNVECSYDPETTIVTLDVNDSSPTMNSTQYVSYPYRRFFNTDEHMDIPQYRIDKAMEGING